MSEKRWINEETLDIRNFTAAEKKKKVNVYVCIKFNASACVRTFFFTVVVFGNRRHLTKKQ